MASAKLLKPASSKERVAMVMAEIPLFAGRAPGSATGKVKHAQKQAVAEEFRRNDARLLPQCNRASRRPSRLTACSGCHRRLAFARALLRSSLARDRYSREEKSQCSQS